jgi:general secretion pathway protein G
VKGIAEMRFIPSREAHDSEGGFSLMELLVVLVILAILAMVVAPNVLRYIGTSKVDATHTQIQNIQTALDLYALNEGGYPSTADGLAALVRKPANVPDWRGPYLRGDKVPLDGWGQPFVYHSPGKNSLYDLVSLGANSKEGGEGDAADIHASER